MSVRVVLTVLALAIGPSARAQDPWSTLSLADAAPVASCDALAARIGAPVDDAQRLTLAACLVRQDPASAERVLQGIGPSSPVASFAALLRADAAASLGKPADALTALDGVTLTGSAAREASLVRARARLALHRSLESRDELRGMLTGPDADEARFLLAQGAEDRGDKDAAVVTYRKVWTDSTRGAWATAAAERLAALGSPVPDLKSPEGLALVRARAASLSSAQQHGDALALELMARAVDHTPDDDALARLEFKAHAYTDAVRTWRAVFGDDGAKVTDARTLFDMALALARTGDYHGAATLYRSVTARFPGTPQADEASYKLGYMAADRGQCADAIARFDEHLAAFPRSAWASSARWFSGWCRWTLGDRDAARATWAPISLTDPRSALAVATAYWSARDQGLDGDTLGEQQALQQLLQRWPDSAYAWLAAHRLRREFPSVPDALPAAWPATLASKPEVTRAETLVQAGLATWALPDLRAVEAEARATRDGALALAWAYLRAGAPQDAQRLARPYCVDPWRGGDPVAQQVCWPRPGRDIIDVVADRYHLPRNLPYAIMTVESALDASVTSLVGARGLMQIMPHLVGDLHVAAQVAGPPDADRLWTVPYATALGTTELGLRWQALQGFVAPDATPAVIASYNGGEDAVRRWVMELGGPPIEMDTFSEEVGYTETRRYVRSVLGQLMIYTWVYGER